MFQSLPSPLRLIAAALLLAAVPAAAQPNATLRAVLEAHNDVREAKGVPALEWSDELATDAQSWADELAKGPDCTGDHSDLGHGENLYLCFGDCKADRGLMKQAVERWTGEEQWFDDGSGVCTAPPGRSCLHYTQVVWCASRRLGCGFSECGQGTILVCHYDPPGNYTGRSPFACPPRE